MDADINTDGKTALSIVNSTCCASGPILNTQRFKVSISGQRYELMRDTLDKHPSTRLGKIAQGRKHSLCNNAPQKLYDEFDRTTGEFFFERNPSCFPLVISYYKTGTLHIPRHICVELFQEEMEYWGIPFHPTSCCQGYHQQEWEMIETLRKTNELFENKVNIKNMGSEDGPIINLNQVSKTIKWKRKIWDLFENSESSKAAYVVSIVSSAMVIISTITLCLNTLPEVKITLPTGEHEDNPELAIVEIICITWFTIEYWARFSSCPDKKLFLLSVMNTIDLLAILPFYIGLIIENLNGDINHNFTDVRRFVQILRIFRIVRIFKVARHSAGLQVLGYTVRNSGSELSLLLLLLLMGMTLFSSLVYYAEEDVEGTKFTSIIAAFWWAIITMTTVGYGDIVPVTLMGQIIGSMCCVSGILFIALPIPTIVSNFSAFYKDHLNKGKFSKLYNCDDEEESTTSSNMLFPSSSKSLYRPAIVQDKRVGLAQVERLETYRRRFSTISRVGIEAPPFMRNACGNRVYPLEEE